MFKNINEFLPLIGGVKQTGERQYEGECPGHDDHHPSLSISYDEQKIFIHCHAGCAPEQILKPLGLSIRDLYFNKEPVKKEKKKKVEKKYVRTHIYKDKNGNIIAQKKIFKDSDGRKSAEWYRYENGEYVKGLNGLSIPLYNVSGIKVAEVIYIVEGEKDADTLISAGLAAVSPPNGAGSSWKKEYNEYLYNKDIIILTDNDEAGEKHGIKVANALSNVAKSIKLIPTTSIYSDICEKGDISDVVEAVGLQDAKELLDKAVSSAEIFERESPPEVINDIVTKLRELKIYLNYTYDDKGCSALFTDIFGSKLKFCSTDEYWYFYNGKVWIRDLCGMRARICAKNLYDSMLVYADEISDDAELVKYNKMAHRYGRLSARETLIRDARDNNFFELSKLDAKKELLNCQNGTLNLNDFTFKQHDPEDMLSKICNVEYNPSARSERFEQFMSEVMKNDTEIISYIQRVLGYSLTADTSNQCFYILYGATTRNGKSTLQSVIAYMLGGSKGYSMTANPETFAIKSNKDSRRASGDIARLDGCRFLTVNEPPAGMVLDIAMIKSMTGGDVMTARSLFSSERQFTPAFHLFINTNSLPTINDETAFMSNRIRVIPFDRHFLPHEQDPELKNTLCSKENLSGILNWCLAGLKAYRAEGENIPKAVIEATEAYNQESDIISSFISEYLMESPRSNLSVADLYPHFQDFCSENGYNVKSRTELIEYIKRHRMWYKSGTVNGKTVRNVLKGFDYKPTLQLSTMSDETA